MKLRRLMLTTLVFSLGIIPSTTPGYCGKLPEKHQTAQGIEFISGGASFEERDAFRNLAKCYNLKLIFVQTSGEYLSMVAVRIRNAAGNLLLETTTNGPWFLAKLPAGTYHISATHDGNEQQRSRKIGSVPTKMIFRWGVPPS